MANKVSIAKEVLVPKNHDPNNVNIKVDMNKSSNRFNNKCKVQVAKPNPKKMSSCLIKDIKWYPTEQKLVIEKTNAPDLVVDLSVVMPDPPCITADIIGRNPLTAMKDIIVAHKGTPITASLQKAVDFIQNSFEGSFDREWDKHFVWEDWDEDEESNTDDMHAHIGG